MHLFSRFVLATSFLSAYASVQNVTFQAETTSREDTAVYGPVFPGNFPDPCIINVNGKWTALATNGNDKRIQVAQSDDFKTWTLLEGQDAFPNPPSWVRNPNSNIWAPDVSQLANGKFLMYFSASSLNGSGTHCVGAGYSDVPEGPYTAMAEPLACNFDQGGSIDSSSFVDWDYKSEGWGYSGHTGTVRQTEQGWTDPKCWGGGKGGQRYMLYKIDGTTKGHGGLCGNDVDPIAPTPIMLQAVDNDDGTTLIGDPVPILQNNGHADQGNIEAPSLVKTPVGQYVLFFSSGCFAGDNYKQEYAIADSVQGPYHRQGAIFQTGDVVEGDTLKSPGGGDVYWDGHHMVFHGDFNTSSNRAMYAALIDILHDGTVEA